MAIMGSSPFPQVLLFADPAVPRYASFCNRGDLPLGSGENRGQGVPAELGLAPPAAGAHRAPAVLVRVQVLEGGAATARHGDLW